jgi:hypothetical protein
VIKKRNEDEFAQRMKDALQLDRNELLNKARRISVLSVQEMRRQMILNAQWDLSHN